MRSRVFIVLSGGGGKHSNPPSERRVLEIFCQDFEIDEIGGQVEGARTLFQLRMFCVNFR